MTEEIKEQKVKVTRARSTAGVNVKTGELVATRTGGVQFGDRTGTRRNSADAEFNLSVPEGTIPDDMVGRWFEDTGKGEIDTAIEGWWGHVQDRHGVNITRSSGVNRMVLMAKMKDHHKQDSDLQMSRYRASIGEDANKELGSGLESYTPNGVNDKVKVSSDPFADIS